MSPSARTSSRSACVVRTAWRTGRAAVSGGPACATVSRHIATSGQSVQALWLASSGQQGMSAGIADISLMPVPGTAAGALLGGRNGQACDDRDRQQPGDEGTEGHRRLMPWRRGPLEGLSLHFRDRPPCELTLPDAAHCTDQADRCSDE